MLCGLDRGLGEATAPRLSEALVRRFHSDESALAAQLHDITLQVFAEIQGIISSHPSGKLLLQVVVPHQDGVCLHAGMVGMLKTARAEHPWLVPQLIELEAEVAATKAASAVDECVGHPEDFHVRYRDDVRYLGSWKEAVPTASGKQLTWRQDGWHIRPLLSCEPW